MAGAEKNQVRFLIENGGGRYAVSIDLKSNIQVSVLAAGHYVPDVAHWGIP
jgi:hypothetical protein